MSAPLCENPKCVHERGLHYVTVDTGRHGRCVKSGCECQLYIGPELEEPFGVPEALVPKKGAACICRDIQTMHPSRHFRECPQRPKAADNDDAREVARDAALIEFRLLIAAVHDVVLMPAPNVVRDRDPQAHLLALHEMTRHKASVERLIFSLGNARKALDYFDRLGKR